MKDYSNTYTNEMINSVQEIINNNIIDVDISTAVKLTKENNLNTKFYLILRDARNEPRVLTRPSFYDMLVANIIKWNRLSRSFARHRRCVHCYNQ